MTGVLDPRGAWVADRCSIAKALDVVRTRSAFLMLREAFYGATRFADFADARRHQRAGGGSPAARARRARACSSSRTTASPASAPAGNTGSPRKGDELFPVLAALMQWGDRWENDGGRVELRHRDCGERRRALRFAAPRGHEVGPADLELARKPRA